MRICLNRLINITKNFVFSKSMLFSCTSKNLFFNDVLGMIEFNVNIVNNIETTIKEFVTSNVTL